MKMELGHVTLLQADVCELCKYFQQIVSSYLFISHYTLHTILT